jgi:two-component system nitrogen regulation sensor histidine kinase GlnL
MPSSIKSSTRARSLAKTEGTQSLLHLLATLILLVNADGKIEFVNSATEEVFGVPSKSIVGTSLLEYFIDAQSIANALASSQKEHFSALRFDGMLKRTSVESMPVHVIVSPSNHEREVLVELIPFDQMAKQEREGRIIDQALANKELIRNLAHEIKNPLGGIRGAAQLLQLEIESKDLIEYTQVIIREADRLQTLVDRLLAPHRRPQVVTKVNIHEVCERVRSLILAEFPRGLKVRRDYDTSLPDFNGDVEQLIQAVLNIAHNAAQALSQKIATSESQIILQTRVARQVTFSKQRNRLALELHVIDNGPGISESIKDRLFYPLVSGREGGSGLGLNLAQTFIQQHHGLIECESVPGKTDFKILIPLQ